MVDYSGIPKPFALTDGIRAEEEDRRMAERRDGSRKAANTAVPRGGTFDVDGNFNVRNGGIGTIELGGKMNVQGSLDITDAGEATVTGQGPDWYGGDTIPIVTCLGNRTAWNPWVGYNYTQPGVYFTKGESLGALDPRVISEGDGAVEVISASELLENGPQVGPNIKSDSSMAIRPWSASIGSGSWDQSVNYEGREGLEGLRGSSYGYFTPSEFSIGLDNYEYLGAIPQGTIASISASLEDRKLRLQGMDGVDIKGPLTVDGQPVGGAVTSVAGKTGAVLLVKADVGLGSVDNTSDANKPISNATQTALNGKAASTHTHATATTTAAGFMSAADKSKLDGAATATFVNGLKRRFRRILGTGLGASIASSTTNWTSFGSTVTVPADLFGVGVPYIITAYAQAAGFPASGAVFSLRLLFNSAQPDGAKTNSPNGPHNATTTVAYDYEVIGSMSVTVAAQAQSVYGASTIGGGADQAFYTVTATPYTAL